jgi:hypothetical protein
MKKVGIVISLVLVGIFSLSLVAFAPGSSASPIVAPETTFEAAAVASVQSVMRGSRRMLA